MQKLPLSRTRFGADIVAEFIVPERDTRKVIIFSTGCPGYSLGKEALMQKYSRLGYWVIAFAYRGTWESGGTFLEYSPAEDVVCIIDNLISFEDAWSGTRHSIKNPEVYLIGGSFGGAASIIASRDARVKKAVAISSVVDWRTQEHTAEPLELMNDFIPKAFGMAYRGEQEIYRKLTVGDFYNPIHEKETLDGSKLQFIHAVDDGIVHAAPAEAFAKEMKAQFVKLSNGGHMGVSSAADPKVFKYIEKFLRAK